MRTDEDLYQSIREVTAQEHASVDASYAASHLDAETIMKRAITVDLDPADVRARTPRFTSRRRRFALAAAVIATGAGLTTGRAVQVANRAPKERVNVERATVGQNTELPRLALRVPGWAPISYAPFPASPFVIGLHVRDDDEWADLTLGRPGVDSEQSVETPIRVGDAEAIRFQTATGWKIHWQVGGAYFSARGPGSPSPKIIEVLAAARNSIDGMVIDTLPSGFEAVPLFPSVGYSIAYARSSPQGDSMSLGISVSERGDFAPDERDNTELVKRAVAADQTASERTYEVVRRDPDPTSPISSLSFRFGAFDIVVIPGMGTDRLEGLLDLADRITEASPKEWRLIERLARDPGYSGFLGSGETENGASYELQALNDDGSSCRMVVLRVEQVKYETCADLEDDAIPFQLLSGVTDRATLAYGIVRPNPHGYVVRIVDSRGRLVGEDFTLDARAIEGQAFVVEVADDAVLPLTAELYDYDRAWFDSFDADSLPDSYVRPGLSPIERRPVPIVEPKG